MELIASQDTMKIDSRIAIYRRANGADRVREMVRRGTCPVDACVHKTRIAVGANARQPQPCPSFMNDRA